MEAINMYFNLIIIPLEKEIKKRKRNINKRFSLTKQIEKTYLEKLEILLNHYYQEFTILVTNELTFNENFQKELSHLENN
ncbi:MAG: hypothetical protein IJ501_00430 [Bacilli bacterium]|nr:hypothetical protein [Bacilli bacterium]